MDDLTAKRSMLCEAAKGIVVPYAEAYAAAHKTFAEKMWPSKKRRSDSAYLRWKFRGKPQGEMPSLLLAVDDQHVVGQLGLIPATLKIGSQALPAQWACDLMVDSGVRQKGIGSMLFAVAMNRDMVTLGSDPSKLADVTMTRMGFRPLVGPYKMVMPLDLKHTLGWVISEKNKSGIPFISRALQPFWSLIVKWRARQVVNGLVPTNLDEIIHRVGIAQSRIEIPYIVHDRDFLTWRFGVVIPAHIQSFVTGSGGYAICEATPAYFYVYDWHAADAQDASVLISNFLAMARAAQSQTISVMANNQQEHNWLRERGYLAMRTPLNIIYYPEHIISTDQRRFHYSIFDSDGNI